MTPLRTGFASISLTLGFWVLGQAAPGSGGEGEPAQDKGGQEDTKKRLYSLEDKLYRRLEEVLPTRPDMSQLWERYSQAKKQVNQMGQYLIADAIYTRAGGPADGAARAEARRRLRAAMEVRDRIVAEAVGRLAEDKQIQELTAQIEEVKREISRASAVADFPEAQSAWLAAVAASDRGLLDEFAKAEAADARRKAAEAEAKGKSGDLETATRLYRDARKSLEAAAVSAKAGANRVKAQEIMRRIPTVTDWATARILLSELQLLIPSDPRAAGLTKDVDALPHPANALTLQLGTNVSMKLVLVPPGTFPMGKPETEKNRWRSEHPVHQVTISKPFYMGLYEVTQEQYATLIGRNPTGAIEKALPSELPVDSVSWLDAVEFCKKLSEKTAKRVTLPTEAQWEYACRAGSTSRFCFGDDENILPAYARIGGWSDARVGQRKPNAFGLYDMHGGLREWCSDWFGKYGESAAVDPQGPQTGKTRVVRGGDYGCAPVVLESAYRSSSQPDYRFNRYGFRVVVVLE